VEPQTRQSLTASRLKCASTHRGLRRLKSYSAKSCLKSPDPPETKFIKHIKIQSKLLTDFWGRQFILELMSCCRPALRNIHKPAIHSSFTTGIFPIPLKASGKSLRIRILNQIIMSDFISAVTTESLRKKLMLFINTGQPVTRRVFSLLRFSMPILFMMIPMRSTPPILVLTVMRSTTS